MLWVPAATVGEAAVDPWGSFLSSVSVLDLGATGLLAITVLMILTGRLVPKSTADGWKNAYLQESSLTREQSKQITMLSASTSVTARVLDALPIASGGEPDGTDSKASGQRRS